MLNIDNFKGYFSAEILHIAQQYLFENLDINLTENDEGCYDARFCEDGVEHWAEITLDSDNMVEDCYCDKCKSLYCIHTAATLLLISIAKQ